MDTEALQPMLISVDDHVTEPPELWTSRLPARFEQRGPHVERDRTAIRIVNGVLRSERGAPDGRWADIWVYEGVEKPLSVIGNAIGYLGADKAQALAEQRACTYEEITPGSWKQADRLADMTINHVEASLCFPNGIPRFCGQTFSENADKELGLLCLRAYNDWMIDEWCAGAARGRLIPLTLVPLWDADLAAAEVRRCAEKGAFAVSFCENPHALHLPSIFDKERFWDPFFRACEETGTVINMHIGSSSKMPTSSPDSPLPLTSVLMFQNSQMSVLDFVLSGVFVRFPALRVAYSEGQIGWLPYLMSRADRVWADPHDGGTGVDLPAPPSSYIPGHVYGCIFDDDVALRCRDLIGMDQIMFEVDYPHAASSHPHTAKLVAEMCDGAGMTSDERYKLVRGNAIVAFGLERVGIDV